jgi:hypothetical protein
VEAEEAALPVSQLQLVAAEDQAQTAIRKQVSEQMLRAVRRRRLVPLEVLAALVTGVRCMWVPVVAELRRLASLGTVAMRNMGHPAAALVAGLMLLARHNRAVAAAQCS